MWLVGVVSRVWLVGGIYGYGYNVEVWLVGVVVRRYIDILIIIINFPYSTCIRSFFGSSILTSLFIFKMFFRSLYIYTRMHIATIHIHIINIGSHAPSTYVRRLLIAFVCCPLLRSWSFESALGLLTIVTTARSS